MSAKNRTRADGEKPKKNPLEYHPTEDAAIRTFLPYLWKHMPKIIRAKRRVLDAGCGKGEIGSVILQSWPNTHVVGIEKHETRAFLASSALQKMADNANNTASVRHADVLSLATPAQAERLGVGGPTAPDLFIANPPFSLAEAFLDVGLKLVAPTEGLVALLLRLDWLASVGRHDRHLKERPDVYVFSRRPSFRANGRTDAQEYAWFLYGPKSRGRWTVILTPPRPKKPRKTAKRQ